MANTFWIITVETSNERGTSSSFHRSAFHAKVENAQRLFSSRFIVSGVIGDDNVSSSTRTIIVWFNANFVLYPYNNVCTQWMWEIENTYIWLIPSETSTTNRTNLISVAFRLESIIFRKLLNDKMMRVCSCARQRAPDCCRCRWCSMMTDMRKEQVLQLEN